MIERIALDNFRGFKSFEWKPAPLNLISGANGAGKSTLLDAIFGLAGVVACGTDAAYLFSPESVSRGSDEKIQRMELDVASANGLYEYSIEVEQDNKDLVPGMVAVCEVLKLKGEILIEVELGIIRQGDTVKDFFDSLSGLKELEDPETVQFCDYLRRIILTSKWAQSQAADGRLDPGLTSFPAWFNAVKYADRDSRLAVARAARSKFGEELSKLIPSEGTGIDPKYFAQLSSGEQALWAQQLIASSLEPASVLMLDDPALHMELGRIQPWLQGCLKAIEGTGSQLFIASHHPEVIDCLGSVAHHWWLGKMRRGSGRSIHRQSSPERLGVSGLSRSGQWPLLE